MLEYFLGIDIARRRDASAFVLLERDTVTEKRRVKWVKEGWGWFYERTVTVAKQIERQLGNSLICIAIDSTGMGDPVYEQLAYQDVGGKPLGGKVMPVVFTNKNKEAMMRALIILLEKGKLEISPEYRRLLNQMKSQTYRITASRTIYGHPEGGSDMGDASFHDDLLWALCLACWADYNYPIGSGRAGVRFTAEKEERRKSLSIWGRIKEALGYGETRATGKA